MTRSRLRLWRGVMVILAALCGNAVKAEEPGYFDIDLAFQTRAFADQGLQGQSRDQPSASIKFSFSRMWDESAQAFTVTPFYRYDSEDDERTHADLRELYWTRLGEDWEFHLGARQVFWGVTEFKHLVDVINQTDLVEDIDGEDKLGQPMAHLSLVRAGGILDLYVLTGFRERTFPGEEGRLRPPVAIDPDAARYESDDRERHVDAAVRWSQDIGPLSYGIYHFAGTSRDPLFQPALEAGGSLTLVPYYPQIDQTGLDAQLVAGDWAFKLEAISRSGFGERYEAFNAGFERTLVSVLGTRSDLGLVFEYMHDARGEEAFDTLFEQDLALGTRVSFNDMADTQALAGFIVDHETKEHVLSLEATRRLGDRWTMALEGRLFGGTDSLDPDMPTPMLLSSELERSAPLQRDDYVQLEFTRFF